MLGSTCLESNGCEKFNSAAAKLERAARQLENREIDLMLGINQVTQTYIEVEIWG